MTDKPKKLSATARALLTSAAMRDDHLIYPPQLPIAAARQVARSLLGSGFAEEVPASDEAADLGWPVGNGGRSLVLRATAVGLARIADGADTKAASVANEATAEAAALLTKIGSDAGNAATARRQPQDTSPASLCRPAGDVPVGPGVHNGRQKAAPKACRGCRRGQRVRAARWAAGGGGLRAAVQALLGAWDHSDRR